MARKLIVWNTDPTNKYTDADGVEDGDEVQAGTNPLITDADNGNTVVTFRKA